MSGATRSSSSSSSACSLLVTVMGFVAARWKRAETLDNLDEWGLGGRNFGSWVTWFLLGGDLYTAYTFVAVPALVFGVGALGFFAVPYTIVLYPLALLAAIRMWSVAHRNGFVTPADFVRGRHGSSGLALAVAVTGIVATMPYIALQLVGIEAILKTMGVEGHLPLILAFAVLAAYTYSVRPARAGADRVRQGQPDLHRRARRDHRDPDPARRLRRDLRGGEREVQRLRARRRTASCSPTRRRSGTRRWPSGPRSRCSCTRTR